MENNSQGIGNTYPARFQNYYGPVSPRCFPFSPFLNRSICSGYCIPVLFFCLRGADNVSITFTALQIEYPRNHTWGNIFTLRPESYEETLNFAPEPDALRERFWGDLRVGILQKNCYDQRGKCGISKDGRSKSSRLRGSSAKSPCHFTIKKWRLILLHLNLWLLPPVGSDAM